MIRFVWLVLLLTAVNDLRAQAKATPQEVLPMDSASLSHKASTYVYPYGDFIYAIFPQLNFTGPVQLNSYLRDRGIPEVNTSLLQFGLGYQRRWHSFCIGVELSTGGFETENDAYIMQSNVNMLAASIKVFVYQKKRLGVYPFAGLNSYSNRVFITDKTNPSSMQTLFTQSNSTNVRLFTGFVMGGIGMDVFDFTKESAFYGGIKMGYRVNIGTNENNSWNVGANSSIPDSPIEQLNMFFIQLHLGVNFNTVQEVEPF